MALTKVNYVDGVTTIMAKNLNDIQDEVIANGTAITNQSTQISSKADAAALTAETAAREAAVSAEATAREAAVSAEAAARAAAINAEATARADSDTALRGEVNGLKSAASDKDLFDDIPGTTQTVTFNANDQPASVVHTSGTDTVRSDVFTWGDDTVTEVRTLANGRHVTYVTNLTTLVTTISAVEEAT